MAYNHFSGLVDLSVSGKGFTDSDFSYGVSICIPKIEQNGGQSNWSALFPTIYGSMDNRKRRKHYKQLKKKSLDFYLPWITKVLIQHPGKELDKTQLEPNLENIDPSIYPNLFKKSNVNLKKEEVISLVGLGMNLPDLDEAHADTTNIDAQLNEDCQLCLCDYLSRGSRTCGSRSHDHGRHQRCICECYCHLKPSDMSLVHLAAKSGHIKILEQLLRNGESADEADLFDNSPLHLASIHGAIGATALLLQKHVNPNQQNVNGNTPLHVAARYGHTGTVSTLLKNGANINIFNNERQTALHIAVRENHHNVIQNMFRYPQLRLNCKDIHGNTALHYAVELSDIKVTEMLLKQKKMDVNEKNDNGETALHIATRLGRTDLISLLLQFPSIAADSGDNDGNTALHLAVKFCNGAALQELVAAKKVFGSQEVRIQKLPPIDKGRLNTARSTYRANDDDFGNGLSIDIVSQLKTKIDLNAINAEGCTALHMAITNNAGLPIIRELVENGCDLTIRDSSGNNALHLAVSRGNFVVARALLSAGVDVDASNYDGSTALHIACNYNDTRLACTLLNAGADPNRLDVNRRTTLHVASEMSSRNLASILLQNGANFSHCDIDGRTPLHTALVNNDERMAITLLKDCSAKDVVVADRKGDTALHIACKLGLGKVVKKLLLLCQDHINLKNVYGNSPLHYACKYGHSHVVKLLMESAEDHGYLDQILISENIAGKTPLHMAAKAGNISSANLLVNSGAAVNYQDKHGRTPMHMLAACKDTQAAKDTAKLLMISGATVDSSDLQGNTPLHAAARMGNNNMVEYLVESGAAMDITNNDEHTPLHLASAFGQEDSLNLLVREGADIEKLTSVGNSAVHGTAASGSRAGLALLIDQGLSPEIKNHDGMTPLHVAADNDQDIIIDYLAEIGVDLCQSDNLGRIPLHIASEKGNIRAVIALLKHGIAVNTPDSGGRTPLHYACMSGHTEIIDMLKDYGGNMQKEDSHKNTPFSLLSGIRKFGQVNEIARQLSYKDLLLINPLDDSQKKEDDYRLVPYLNFVQKLSFDYREGGDQNSQLLQRFPALDCPRYLLHMKAYDQAEKVMAEIEFRTVQSKHSRDYRLKEKQIKKEVRVVSPPQADDLRSHCTEDDIAEQRGLLPSSGTDKQVSINVDNQHVKPDLLEIPLSPDNLVTDIEYRASLPEIFSIKRNSLVPPSYELPMEFEKSGHGDGFAEKEDTLSRSSVEPSEVQPSVESRKTSTVKDVETFKTPTPPPVVIETPPKPKSDFPNFYVPKARTFKKEQMRKSLTPTEEPLAEKGIDIAMKFLGLLSRGPSRNKPVTPDDNASVNDGSKSSSCGNSSDRSDSDQSGESADESDQSSQRHRSAYDGDRLPDIVTDESDEGETLFRVKKPRIKAARSRGDMSGTAPRTRRLTKKTKREAKPKNSSQQDKESSLATGDGVTVFIDGEDANGSLVREKSVPRSASTSRLSMLSASSNRLSDPSRTIAADINPTVKKLSSADKLPEITPVPPSPSNGDPSEDFKSKYGSRLGTIDPKKKRANVRRPGTLLTTTVSTPTLPLSVNKVKKDWIFEDGDQGDDGSLTPQSDKSDSDMSFDIHPRSPSPEPTQDDGPEVNEDVNEVNELETKLSIKLERKKFGKAKIDTRFRDEQERQRLAEERKKKAMKMRLARAQLKNAKLSEHDLVADGKSDLSDSDWLSQYCIFVRGSTEIYRSVFEALLGSTGESPPGSQNLTMTETLMALNQVNRELKNTEQQYIVRLCELLGYDVSQGCDFKHFSLIAALSHRITSLDDFMRRMYRSLDTRLMDINITFCQRLWKACLDADTNLMSKDRLMLELKAGGISQCHEDYVKKTLTGEGMNLDFLDFLTYIPLFLLIHHSVVSNPFNDSRVK